LWFPVPCTIWCILLTERCRLKWLLGGWDFNASVNPFEMRSTLEEEWVIHVRGHFESSWEDSTRVKLPLGWRILGSSPLLIPAAGEWSKFFAELIWVLLSFNPDFIIPQLGVLLNVIILIFFFFCAILYEVNSDFLNFKTWAERLVEPEKLIC